MGPTFADAIGSPLADSIPIYWNAAGGTYAIDGLPTPPAGATDLLLVAQYDGTTVVSPLRFRPIITGINSAYGAAAGGTSMTITGTNFTGATVVDFGTIAATNFTVVSATQITATSPAEAGTVDVTVTAPAELSADLVRRPVHLPCRW